jgi:hypothetical protein
MLPTLIFSIANAQAVFSRWPGRSSTEARSANPENQSMSTSVKSRNPFSVLRLNLAQGRAFLPEEDRTGATSAMILGHSFWQRHFAGGSDALGASVVLDQKRYMVVGVAPAGFRLYGQEAEVYTPLGQDTAGYVRSRGAHPVHVLARLQPGATLLQAQTELEQIGRHLAVTPEIPERDGHTVTSRPILR